MNVADFLRRVDIFEHLSPDELGRIAHRLRQERFEQGQLLHRQGEPADALFIVVSGQIQLASTGAGGQENVLAHFTDGQYFGEMALLAGGPWAESATAERESQVLVLARADFDQLLATHTQLLRDLLQAVSQRTDLANRRLATEPAQGAATAGAGHVYVLFSPRAGAGTTTLAVNLAALLAERRPGRVGLLDLDLSFGNAAHLLGVAPPSSLGAIAPERLDHFDGLTLTRLLVPHHGGLQLLAGATRPEEGEAVTPAHVRAALAAMKRHFSVTVVDAAGSFSPAAVAALHMADRVVLVCTPEISTLRDIRECERLFPEVLHLATSKLYYLLNHPRPLDILTRGRFEAALDQAMALEVPHAGEEAAKAERQGEPLVSHKARSLFARALQSLGSELEPLDAQASGQRGLGEASAGASVPSAPARRRPWLFGRA